MRARIPESPPVWERAADLVPYLSRLFTDIISCCDFFPLGYCERSLGSDFSCTPDKDIRVFHLYLQILSHPCYLTQGRIKIT